MALGDITYDSNPVRLAGDHYVVTGSLEASDTATAFQIVNSQQSILYANIHNQDDVDLTHRLVLNSDDGTADSQAGSLYIDCSGGSPDTYRFEVAFA